MTSQTTEAPQVWLDAEPLATSWPGPRRGARGRWIVLAIIVALAVVAGGLAAAGGLDERDDARLLVQPGEVFETGPFQLSFTEARVWERQYGDAPRDSWVIRVYGQGRTLGVQSDQLSSNWMAAGDAGTEFFEDASMARVGAIRKYGANFQPGLPMAPIELQIRMPPEYVPGDTIDLIITRLVVENRTSSGDRSGEVLSLGRQHFFLVLPLTLGEGDPPS